MSAQGKTNGKILRKLIATSLLFIMLLYSAAGQAGDIFASRYSVTFGQTDARAMLTLINNFRQGNEAWYWNEDNTTKTVCAGLQPLTYDYTLEKVAMQRAAECALYYSHTRPDSSSCFTVWNEYGFINVYRGENIAAGYTTYEDVFNGWKEADKLYSGQGHRRNMLNANFNAIGIGHVVVGGIHFWTHALAGLSSINTNRTTAVDTTKDMDVLIDEDILSSKSIASTSAGTVNIAYGESVTLPMLQANIERDGYWSRITQIKVQPAWVSSDTDAVLVTGNTGKGLVVGKTQLTGVLWNQNCTATINVTYNGITTNVMVLPSQLKTIEINAFEGVKISALDVPAGVTTIPAGAFANCTNLRQIQFRGSDTDIASGAFPAGLALCVICPRGSRAETWANNQQQYTVIRTK